MSGRSVIRDLCESVQTSGKSPKRTACCVFLDGDRTAPRDRHLCRRARRAGRRHDAIGGGSESADGGRHPREPGRLLPAGDRRRPPGRTGRRVVAGEMGATADGENCAIHRRSQGMGGRLASRGGRAHPGRKIRRDAAWHSAIPSGSSRSRGASGTRRTERSRQGYAESRSLELASSPPRRVPPAASRVSCHRCRGVQNNTHASTKRLLLSAAFLPNPS